MIKIRHRGNFAKTDKFLENVRNMFNIRIILNQYGAKGVSALSMATPVDTGLTSASWEYEIEKTSTGYKLVWSNSNVVDGVVIAIILQYGHGTSNGAYVQGRDYINPALRAIFNDFSNKIGEEVAKL